MAFQYTGEHLHEVAFPLGGIGTGCVSLEGRGALRDWEIFNRPNKLSMLPDTFAALWTRAADGKTDCRVVQGPPNREFIGSAAGRTIRHVYGTGLNRAQGNGLPHFATARFTGRFPGARIDFDQPGHPLRVALEAFSPFVPLDVEASSMPVACLRYRLTNAADAPVDAALAFNLFNAVGHYPDADDLPPRETEQAQNTWHLGEHARGLQMTDLGLATDDPRYGTLALATDWEDTTALPHWPRPPHAAWFDAMHAFWDAFSEKGELPRNDDDTGPGRNTAGSLALRVRLAPGQEAALPIVLAWCFPNFVRYWPNAPSSDDTNAQWINAYAKRWPSAWDAAEAFLTREDELSRRTEHFEQALFDSTLPEEVIESLGATATTLRTPTCLQYEDGTFWGWEGCSPTTGCCPGSCTHVWNYALTQAYLFPELHRSMRRSEYEHSIPDNEQGRQGQVSFRIPLPLAQPTKAFNDTAAVDGQLGGVIQLYRDWRLCGDEAYLRHMWPHAKHALEYAWVEWDPDRDGLIEGVQHNTYDIEFHGPNPLAQFMYLGALRAGEAMARHLGDDTAAETYRQLSDRGRALTEQHLFNGEYFEQTTDVRRADAPKYQHGQGCLSDQLLGQLAAHVAGLGHLAAPDQVGAALDAVFAHNFRDPLGDHANPQRIYAVSDESALLLCSWPHGGRPQYPFPYSDEAWTGIEYQVAAHLIFEGRVEEGLRLVRGVRQRHDGRRRNPYNEFECGSHYARALSSWGLLLALSGFRYDAVDEAIVLKPRGARAREMRCLFTTGEAWGTFAYDGTTLTLHVVEGQLPVRRIDATDGKWETDAAPATLSGGTAQTFRLTR
ncbi:MAG: GH116 family glycosyl-hydrolase [bacterium]